MEKGENKACFVIMPFSDVDGYEEGHFYHVYEDIIKPAVKGAGYEPQRSDDEKQTNLIHLDILNRLIDAPIAICDLSSRNPNVLFELGIRQAFDKPVVLIQEKGTQRIFDIAPLRYIEYSKEMRYHEVLAVQRELQEAITATVHASSDNNFNSIVRLLSIGKPAQVPQLDRDKRENLTFDMLNAQVREIRNMLDLVLNNSNRQVLYFEQDRDLALLENQFRGTRELMRREQITESEARDKYQDIIRRAERSISDNMEPESRRRYRMLIDRVFLEMTRNTRETK